MQFRVTKTYGHELGLSACFRQWRAKSHCRFLHGYALAFKFEFGAESLDENGWVIDFGSLKDIKQCLVSVFDHKLLVAADDPAFKHVVDLDNLLIADTFVMVDGVGCEKFAQFAFNMAVNYIERSGVIEYQARGVRVISCECREHAGNSAIYTHPDFT